MDKFFNKVVLLLVTRAGIGYIPRLPGTVGTIIAIPFSLALNRIALSNFLVATVLLIGSVAGAVWLCSQFAGMLNQKDPQLIVIDEIIGFLVGNFLAPFSLTALLWSFALFPLLRYQQNFPSKQIGTAAGRRRHCAG